MSIHDQARWNEKYHSSQLKKDFLPHQLLRYLESSGLLAQLPNGPILELACGLSGNALALAESGFSVLAVDISDVALKLLDSEIQRRNLQSLITIQQLDLDHWQPPTNRFAMVLCTRYWQLNLFSRLLPSLQPGGLIAWQTFNLSYLSQRPSFQSQWCLADAQPASLLSSDFQVLEQIDIDQVERRLIAKKS